MHSSVRQSLKRIAPPADKVTSLPLPDTIVVLEHGIVIETVSPEREKKRKERLVEGLSTRSISVPYAVS